MNLKQHTNQDEFVGTDVCEIFGIEPDTMTAAEFIKIIADARKIIEKQPLQDSVVYYPGG